MKEWRPWHIWVFMLGGILAVKQASGFECLAFDPFSFQQDSLATPEVDVSGREVGDAFMATQVIVMADEVSDLQFEIAGQDSSSQAGCGS